MACCMNFAKVFLITLNGIFGLLGLAMLGIGGYVMVEVKKYSGVTESSYDAIPIFILCLGLFVFLLSFLGLFGACKENKCMNGTYAVVLSILVLCQISAGIAGFVKKDAIDGLIEKELHNSMKDFGVDNVNVTKTGEEPEYNPVAAAWNVIQKEFKCSGTDGYEDWTNTTIMGADSRFSQYLDSVGYKKGEVVPGKCDPSACPAYPVPDSSCQKQAVNCGWTYADVDKDIYKEGCADKLNDWLSDNIAIIAGAAVGIAVVEMIGVIFSCYILKNGGYDDYSNYN